MMTSSVKDVDDKAFIDGVGIHLCFHSDNYPLIEDFSTLASEGTEGWKKAVLVFDKNYSHYYGWSEEEWAWIQAAKIVLSKTTPEEFQTGNHVLFPNASFMGESICISNKQICTTLHATHKKCDEDQIICIKSSYFCIKCSEEIKPSKMVLW